MNSRHELETSSAAELDTDAFHPTRAGEANQSVTSVPGKPGMIVRSYPFLDLEMPVEFMTEWITPVSRFFVRNHMFEPAGIDPATWKLTINGQVLSATLGDNAVARDFLALLPLTLDLEGGDAGSIAAVGLRYRHLDQSEEYEEVEMAREANRFVATISGGYSDSPYALQYHFVIRDVRGGARLHPGLGAELSDRPYHMVRQEQALRRLDRSA